MFCMDMTDSRTWFGEVTYFGSTEWPEDESKEEPPNSPPSWEPSSSMTR